MNLEQKIFERDAFQDQQTLTSDHEVKVIFDIGANVGNTVENYFYQYPKATVHAFEPDPETHAALSARFQQHPRVKPYCLAVSDCSKTQTFYVNHDKGTSSLLPRPKSGRRYFNKHGVLNEEIKVPTVTLDEFCHQQGIDSIDILKLDIQGGEFKALKGAAGLLAAKRVGLVYAEVQFVPLYEGAPLYHELSLMLDSFGYTLYGIYDLVNARNGQLRFADAIFIPAAVREFVLDRFPEEPY